MSREAGKTTWHDRGSVPAASRLHADPALRHGATGPQWGASALANDRMATQSDVAETGKRAPPRPRLDDVRTLIASVDGRTLEIAGSRTTASLRRRRSFMGRTLLFGDVLALAAAFILAQVIVRMATPVTPGAIQPWTEAALFLLTLPMWALLGLAYGLYGRDAMRTDHTTVDDLVSTFHLVTVGAWLVYAGSLLTDLASPTPGKIAAFWVLAIALVTVVRASVRFVARRRLAYLQNTVIVGAGHVGQLVARKFLRRSDWGLNIVGFVDAHPKERHPDVAHLPLLGPPELMPTIVRLFDVERVVIAFSGDSHTDTLKLVRRLSDLHVHVDIVPRLFESLGPSGYIQTVEGLTIIGLPPLRLSRIARRAKRTIDLVGAGVGLVVLTPLLLLIAAAIRLESRGWPLYRHRRVGVNGKLFDLFKFRTMHSRYCRGPRYGGDGAEHAFARLMSDPSCRREFEEDFKLTSDPRVTKVGAFLRRTSLDELPQLLNVLLGDLSLVGPRPIVTDEMALYASDAADQSSIGREVTGYWDIPDLRPGITGYWQINGRSDSSYAERVRLDTAYVRNWSVRLDLEILARTLRVIVSKRGAY
jgi:exopolysaccharide biosynthesis polyprenyl glycosylphosphotransferase